MNGRIVLRVLLALVIVAGVVGAGIYVYNVGVAQGLAASGKVARAGDGRRAVSVFRRAIFLSPAIWLRVRVL